MNVKSALLALAVAAGFFFAPASKADEWDKKTVVTFDKPVEIPGRVLLPGTYVFKLLDSSSDRDIVQIFTKDEKQILATVLAVPDYRLKTPDKTQFQFAERSADSPEAVRSWFYPGDNFGWEFVYGKEAVAQVARQTPAPAPATPSSAPQMAEQPQASEPAAMENEPVQTAANQEPPPTEAAPAQMPATLPHTASYFPLLAMTGTMLMVAGIAIRVKAR